LYVNGEAVEQEVIEQEIERMRPEYEQTFADEPEKEREERLIAWSRENVIERVCVHQEACKRFAEVSSEDIDAAREQLTKGAEVSAEDLEGLNKSVADQIRVERMLGEVCGDVDTASDEEISAIYEECKGQFVEPECVHAWHVHKRIDGQTDQAGAMGLMEIAKADLEAGALFELVVGKNSDCKENGGDLGFIYRGQMVEEFEDVVFNLGEGEISDIFPSRFGLHIARVTERKPERERGVDEVREELESRVAEDKKRKKLEEYLDSLIAAATVEDK
jgi:hypothetical protein